MDVGFEPHLERLDLLNRPALDVLGYSRQFRQGHEHSGYMATVRTVGAARDSSKVGYRKELLDPTLNGLGDLQGDLTKRDRLSMEPLERQRVRRRARFLPDRKTQAVDVPRHHFLDFAMFS
jgi:hypothetical protein